MRIVLSMAHMYEGGAERCAAIMSSYWADRGDHVSLCVHDRLDSYYELNPKVECLFLNNKAIVKNVPGTRTLLGLLAIRRAIRKSNPDVVVAFTTGASTYTLLATLFTKYPVIVHDHCDRNHNPLEKKFQILMKLLYPRAASVVALTEGAMSFYSPSLQKRGRIIPNPVVKPPVTIPTSDSGRQNRIVTLGRLSWVKGQDRLIKAFGLIAGKFPNWSLDIWGEGPQRSELEALISDLSLESQVHLPGRTSEPYMKLATSKIFALSSYTEGFPMSLCEAMSLGSAVVSFDCPSGPRAIIRDEVDGKLVPDGDVNALGSAFSSLMSDDDLRVRLGASATDITNRFGIDQVMLQWDELFNHIRNVQ